MLVVTRHNQALVQSLEGRRKQLSYDIMFTARDVTLGIIEKLTCQRRMPID